VPIVFHATRGQNVLARGMLFRYPANIACSAGIVMKARSNACRSIQRPGGLKPSNHRS